MAQNSSIEWRDALSVTLNMARFTQRQAVRYFIPQSGVITPGLNMVGIKVPPFAIATIAASVIIAFVYLPPPLAVLITLTEQSGFFGTAVNVAMVILSVGLVFELTPSDIFPLFFGALYTTLRAWFSEGGARIVFVEFEKAVTYFLSMFFGKFFTAPGVLRIVNPATRNTDRGTAVAPAIVNMIITKRFPLAALSAMLFSVIDTALIFLKRYTLFLGG